MRRLSACRKKSVFYKIEQIIYHYKNALWALRLCNRGRLLSVRPAPTLFDHLYASLHKAFGRSISASLPKPQTPSPRERLCMLGWLCIVQSPCAYTPGIRAGAECGAAALTQQGCLQSVAHSRCTTQRHQRLTTRIGATPQTPVRHL